jgi:very-short-patch-repair endonuclease
MSAMAIPAQLTDPASILDRHAARRMSGIPTISLLAGPTGAGGRIWARWAARTGRCTLSANGNQWPLVEWLRLLAEQLDLPVAAVHLLARRANRDPEEFLRAWRVKTASDRDNLWTALAAEENDDILQAMTALAVHGVPRSTIAPSLSTFGEKIVPMLARLAPGAVLPAVLFLAGSSNEFSAAGREAAAWAVRAASVPVGIAVPGTVWNEYLATTPDSRTKSLLREGEIPIPTLDAAAKESLTAIGAPAAALLAEHGADAALVESAVALVRATTVRPASEAENNRARSAAEQFLFEFLQSLPQTAGRFELNAIVDFRFGSRWAEVDLLCRQPPIALEIDGYFHFGRPEDYRRDRAKDWELQRRGYLVLRFLAEDVIPQLEVIRDRIVDALNRPGGPE